MKRIAQIVISTGPDQTKKSTDMATATDTVYADTKLSRQTSVKLDVGPYYVGPT